MCTNYTPAAPELLQDLLEPGLPLTYPPETFPDYDSPLILLNQDGRHECRVANFGFAPQGLAHPGMPNPVNARAETVATNRMFGKYWSACQLCVVPVEALYEPCYETGRAVRHKIWLKNASEFGIAGLWRTWPEPDGGPPHYAFAMLTVNADDHAVFRRMHRPTNPDGSAKEKRGVVILPRDQWAAWLACKDPQVARSFLRLYPAEGLESAPAPVPRKPPARGGQRPTSGDLF